MSSAAFEANLLEIPDLPFLLDRRRSSLDDEQGQRDEFRAWLTPQVKAAFINGEIVMHSPASEDHNEANGNLHTFEDRIESISLNGFSIPIKAIFDADENARTTQDFLQLPKI